MWCLSKHNAVTKIIIPYFYLNLFTIKPFRSAQIDFIILKYFELIILVFCEWEILVEVELILKEFVQGSTIIVPSSTWCLVPVMYAMFLMGKVLVKL